METSARLGMQIDISPHIFIIFRIVQYRDQGEDIKLACAWFCNFLMEYENKT